MVTYTIFFISHKWQWKWVSISGEEELIENGKWQFWGVRTL